MGNLSRKMQRKQQKNNGEFIYKKKLAKQLGISVTELNARLARREKNLKSMEGTDNGKE